MHNPCFWETKPAREAKRAGILAGVPVISLCCRVNVVSLSDSGAAALGVRPPAIRGIGMMCAGLLSMTALIHCGSLGILSMAMLLNGTSSRFSVNYDVETNSISIVTGQAYTAVGGELATGTDKSKSWVLSLQTLTINGEEASITAITLAETFSSSSVNWVPLLASIGTSAFPV